MKKCLTFASVFDIITHAVAIERLHDGEWCNGSTYDSDSYCQGSNPCSPATLPPLSRGLGRRPLKAETGVRIPLGVPRKTTVVKQDIRWFFLAFLGKSNTLLAADCIGML